ncbi:MAG: hypothetical protein JWO92_1333 [Chitinophagaceae bacterium]|nr:hypothetical protein [Chitinophagaceae bacterium]
MDKISLPGNFSQSFPDISSKEENFTAINPVRITCENIYLNRENLNTQLPGSTIPLENIWNFIIKRCFDVLLSLILIVFILSWLIPLLAILIKLDSRGPIFFLQKRNKNGGRLFTCIKFRSMFVNKDADTLVACENDKRITRFGKFLRNYHVDELPQLFNVLTGDMSIIGPRPHMISENLLYGNLLPEYTYRHTVKPGITGLAQSLGNFGSTNSLEKVKERVRLDILYINKWSLGMDIKILFRTSLIMLGFAEINK